MTSSTQEFFKSLGDARKRKGLSQRELGDRVGLPQSHISRIESGAVDVQTSNLIELARALDLEPVLVPRQLLPAFAELQRHFRSAKPATQTPMYRLSDEDDVD